MIVDEVHRLCACQHVCHSHNCKQQTTCHENDLQVNFPNVSKDGCCMKLPPA